MNIKTDNDVVRPFSPPFAGHISLEISVADHHRSITLFIHKADLGQFMEWKSLESYFVKVIDLKQTPIQVLLNITMSFSLILGLLCSLVSISFWMWAKILFLPLLSLEASSISELLLFLPDYRVDKIPWNVSDGWSTSKTFPKLLRSSSNSSSSSTFVFSFSAWETMFKFNLEFIVEDVKSIVLTAFFLEDLYKISYQGDLDTNELRCLPASIIIISRWGRLTSKAKQT